MAKTWKVEIAKTSDAEAIQKLLKETWLKTYPNEEFGVTIEDVKSKKFLSKEVIEKRRELLRTNSTQRIDYMVRNGKELRGWCAAEKKKNYGQIKTLYVHPDFQGQGIGRVLMSNALEWLRDYRLIIVEVAIYNKKAIEFYKKSGFTIKISTFEYTFPNGKKIPTLILGRRR